jgi:hypothetical protein
MPAINYIIVFLLLITIVIFYRKYQEKNTVYNEEKTYDYLLNHVLDNKRVLEDKKPILWIYVPYQYNSRHWASFGSRSSCDLNQPYLNLTVRSIIKNCDSSFHICLIDDRSFAKLIPDWSINMSLIPDPILSYVRQMAMAKLIYNYGGINVPISFLCFKNLADLYETNVQNGTMFIGENVDRNITSTHKDFYPNLDFMGANKQNETVQELIDFMQRIISNDHTAQADFLGDFNRWCNTRVEGGIIRLVDGNLLGTKTLDDTPVLVENLLGESYVNYYRDMYGIWIPAEMILKRRHYEWFARMSVSQVLQGNFILAKYLLLASAPDSHLGVIETMKEKPDWVSFWKVPSGAPVWGLKPIDLGNHVPRVRN